MKLCNAILRNGTMIRTLWTSFLLGLVVFVPRLALAGDTCRTMTFEGTPFTVCTAQADDDVRLWLRNDDKVIGSPARVAQTLASGERLVFAMNAGMYEPDRSPVGLYIENGDETSELVTRSTGGNFSLTPNGVFCVGNGFRVVETNAYAENPPECRFATQSGPMLVIDGALHPRFLPDSDSTYIRNGVGVSGDGQTAWFVISDRPVNFHRFARFFRDELGAPNALYFDGSVSRLTVPDQGRNDFGFPVGPIVGMVTHD